MNQASWVGLKIHLDLALSDNVAGLGIIFKVSAVDLVEAAGIASIKRDRDIVQFRPAACLNCTALLA